MAPHVPIIMASQSIAVILFNISFYRAWNCMLMYRPKPTFTLHTSSQVQCAGYVTAAGRDAYQFIKLVFCPCKSSIQTGPENPVTIWQGYLCLNTPGLSSPKLSKSCSS
jgi:hypothetical protein